ncbi:MAG: hypothetical protein AAF531_05250 [Actinomycetota bacterium]
MSGQQLDPGDRATTEPQDAASAFRSLRSNVLVRGSLVVIAAGYAVYAVAAPGVPALEGTVSEDLLEQLTRAPVFLILTWIIFEITRRRPLPDYGSRSPDAANATFELLAIAGYTLAAMVVLGFFGITYHPQENDPSLSQGDLVLWAAVNPIVYALIPYLWLRSRGNSATDLGLRGNRWRLDWKLLAVVGGIDMILAIIFSDYLELELGQMALATPLTFVLFGLGAGIPVVLLTQAVVAPRVYAITGSHLSAGAASVIAYALFSSTDRGLLYDSAGHAVLSFLFITVANFGPGLVKAMLTVRTGNAWLHFLAYHVVSFHIWADAPLVARIFEL